MQVHLREALYCYYIVISERKVRYLSFWILASTRKKIFFFKKCDKWYCYGVFVDMVDMTDMFLENCFFKIKYITCEVFFEATYMDIFQTSELTMNNFVLTLSWRKPISYRNQSIDLLSKSMDWFLYDIGLCHERVKPLNSLCHRVFAFSY